MRPQLFARMSNYYIIYEKNGSNKSSVRDQNYKIACSISIFDRFSAKINSLIQFDQNSSSKRN